MTASIHLGAAAPGVGVGRRDKDVTKAHARGAGRGQRRGARGPGSGPGGRGPGAAAPSSQRCGRTSGVRARSAGKSRRPSPPWAAGPAGGGARPAAGNPAAVGPAAVGPRPSGTKSDFEVPCARCICVSGPRGPKKEGPPKAHRAISARPGPSARAADVPQSPIFCQPREAARATDRGRPVFYASSGKGYASWAARRRVGTSSLRAKGPW